MCMFCWRYVYNYRCEAYPKGIPEEILTGEHDHTKPYEGDNDIQFEPIEET
ncbi:unnamed protein product [marine sediment metagenome]|uniref:Uncharacterized protein n=1 Tax=marine sediment metagenome TaxID=412755 RepID=X0SCN4_9ZZZZ